MCSKTENGEYVFATVSTCVPFHRTKHTPSPTVPEIHDLHFTCFHCSPLLACFSQLRWIIELHWGAGTRSAYSDVSLRHSQSMSWREKRSAVDILVSVPHTPQIPNGPHDMQLQSNTREPVHVARRSRRWEEEVKLGFIARVWWRWRRKWDRGDVGAVFVLAVGNLKADQAAVYISLLCSPPEAQVCVAAPSVGARWLDELHLSKWMLLISTPCYMDHLRPWWV